MEGEFLWRGGGRERGGGIILGLGLWFLYIGGKMYKLRIVYSLGFEIHGIRVSTKSTEIDPPRNLMIPQYSINVMLYKTLVIYTYVAEYREEDCTFCKSDGTHVHATLSVEVRTP